MRTRLILSIILFVLALACNGCEQTASTGKGRSSGSNGSLGTSNYYDAPARLAELEDRAVTESSGIVASRRNPDSFWTHNDSGDRPVIYAFDRQGRNLGRWRVTGAESRDWEDIAAGPGPRPGVPYLYIGDIGDNGERRDEVIIYRVAEPTILTNEDSSDPGKQRATEPAEAIRLKYPDGAHNAETLMVHPTTGDLYIVTKDISSTVGVYKMSAPFSGGSVNRLSKIAEIGVPNLVGGLITGGDISPDGRRVVLCDYLSGYEISLPEDAGKDFDQIWKQPMATVSLGPRRQGEAICYRLDGNAILATSEKRPAPLIEVKKSSGQ